MPSNDHFKLLYFAAASSYTGRESEAFPAPLPLNKLYTVLESRYPGIVEKVLGSCALTVNLEYVDVAEGSEALDDKTGIIIQPGDEVAIIPPVSSG